MAASTLTIKDSLGGTTQAYEASVPVQMEVVYTIPNTWLAGPVVATITAGAGISAMSPSGVGAATYTVTYVNVVGATVPLTVSGSAVGDYVIGPVSTWIRSGTSVMAQLVAVGSPAWTCAVGCVVQPIL